MDTERLVQMTLRHADAIRAPEGAAETSVAGFCVCRTRHPTVLTHEVLNPVFCLVLQGRKELAAGGRQIAFGAMQSIIVSLDLPVRSRIVEASPMRPYLALALTLDPALLIELSEAVPEAARPTGTGAPGLGRLGADAAILDAMGRLLALCEQPDHVREILVPMLKREIHFWLLHSDHRALLGGIAAAGSPDHRISRVIADIRRRFADRLKTEDLARAAGMSGSAFHARFRAMTGTSPLQFQKSLRLIEARRTLGDGRHNVAAAAFAVGYESPTQFSRDYSRMFGEPPSATLRAGQPAA